MPKETRDAVVSVRMSAEEQERLRLLAESRGGSVSDLIRAYVRQETGERLPRGETAASSSRTATYPEQGPFWTGPAGAVADGANLTVAVTNPWTHDPTP